MEREPNRDERAVFTRADREAFDLNRRLKPIRTRVEHIASAGAKPPNQSKN